MKHFSNLPKIINGRKRKITRRRETGPIRPTGSKLICARDYVTPPWWNDVRLGFRLKTRHRGSPAKSQAVPPAVERSQSKQSKTFWRSARRKWGKGLAASKFILYALCSIVCDCGSLFSFFNLLTSNWDFYGFFSFVAHPASVYECCDRFKSVISKNGTIIKILVDISFSSLLPFISVIILLRSVCECHQKFHLLSVFFIQMSQHEIA